LKEIGDVNTVCDHYLKDAEKASNEQLANIELTPYPNFEVKFIRIYELNIEEQRYEKYLDVPLSKGS
ncbi:MAG: hypothetical protein ABS898_06185, partial [Psychrobacillus sp.]